MHLQKGSEGNYENDRLTVIIFLIDKIMIIVRNDFWACDDWTDVIMV